MTAPNGAPTQGRADVVEADYAKGWFRFTREPAGSV